MSYPDSKDGCIDFMIPKDAQEAVKAAWEFAKTDILNKTEDGSKEWDYGPFSCLGNIKLTLVAMCCPCWASCIRYRTMEYMSEKPCEVAFVNGIVTGAVCLGCCHYAVVRGQFRKKYGLKGSPCQDCMCGWCLGPCLLCSDANQLMVSQGIQVPYLNIPGTGNAVTKVNPVTK